MPHIHLQTTSDLEENAKLPDILEALTEALAAFDSVPSKGIKAFHTLRSVWVMGGGAPDGFAHCEVAILEGRSSELKKEIATDLFEVLKQEFAESITTGAASVTLEIREMVAETYRK
jgi:5-carboxymethyl-2-hydroxymuconate isomerase